MTAECSGYDARVRWLLCAWALIACGDNLGAGPTLEITSPERGLISEATTVVVEGRATAGIAGVFGVEVNGERAELDDSGRFAVELELGPGTHRIVTLAVGKNGIRTRDVRAVSLGPRAGAAPVEAGVLVGIGTVGLARVARERLLPAIDMAPVYSQVTAAPIADVGAGCPRDIISVAEISAPISQVFLYGLLDGLGGEILFMPIETMMSADYTDSACDVASGTFDFDTLELHLTFTVDLGISGGEPAIELGDEFRLYDHELLATPIDIPEPEFSRVSADIETHLADALVPAALDEYSARLAAWMAGFASTRTGTSIELTSSLAEIGSGSDGISLVLDLEASGVKAGSWVPTPAPPVTPVSPRAAVAVADDAVDQVLGAMWASGELDAVISSGRLEMRAPPAVSRASVVIGDWILSGDGVEIAFSGTVPLEAAGDGEVVSLIAGEPDLEAQIIGGGPGNPEAALAEARELLSGRITEGLEILAVGVGEAVAPELGVTARGGYLVIDTFVPPPSIF